MCVQSAIEQVGLHRALHTACAPKCPQRSCVVVTPAVVLLVVLLVLAALLGLAAARSLACASRASGDEDEEAARPVLERIGSGAPPTSKRSRAKRTAGRAPPRASNAAPVVPRTRTATPRGGSVSGKQPRGERRRSAVP